MNANTIIIDNVALEYAWFGSAPPDSFTIVLLHEGLGSLSAWRNFPEALSAATGMRVFAYSRADHGKSGPGISPRPPDALHREALRVLPELLNKIGFQRGILLGHSDGASIVAIYASHVHDQGVEGIVLIEPHFNVEEKNLNSIRSLAENFGSTDLRQRLARHHSNVDRMFAAWREMWLNAAFLSFDITTELEGIRVPMLFVKGEDDPYSTMLQPELAKAHSGGPVETIIIPGAGHSPHRNDQKAVIDAITRFIDKILNRERPPLS
jgi:pimeloyl-ACP methyl ester carboxylesterase